MAAQSETTGDDGRRLLTAGLALLGGATGLALGPVFAGGGSGLRLALAGAAAALLAALLERRHVLLSLAGAAAGLGLAVGLLVFPGTTAVGLPTSETVAAVGRALGRVAVDASKEAAPAPPLPSLMLASVAAVWVAGYAAHALAVRAASPVLSLIPPSALVGFAGVVALDGPHPVRVALFLAAAFVILFGTGLRQLRLWGPILPWPGSRRWRLSGAPAGQARRLALAATLVAVILPGILPGFRSAALVDLTTGSSGLAAVSPIVDIRPNLLRNPSIELFRVESETPAYWRLLALDRFDGRIWTSGDLLAESGIELPEGSALSAPPGADPAAGVRVDQAFRITGLTAPWLPAAFFPRRIEVDGTLRFDPDRDTLVREGGTGPGLSYFATSRVVSPSPEQLDRALPPRIDAVPDSYTRLPPNVPPRIRQIARALTADEPTAYRKILAIQDHLRSFTYDEEAPAGHGIDDMLFFLEESRRGYCEQFAGTMAVLLRALGYPARVAVGFLPGELQDDRSWRVTTKDTHAWVEVHFPEFGWLAFEPTPTRMNPVARSYVLPLGPVGAPGPFDADEALARSRRFRQQQLDIEPTLQGSGAAEQGEAEARRGPWVPLAAGLGALAVLVALSVPLLKAAARRLALSRAATPSASAVASLLVLQAGAGDVGLGRGPGETLREFGARLREVLALPPDDLDRVTEPASRALYSRRNVEPEQAEVAARAARSLLREIRRRVGLARTIVGAFRPARPV